MDKKVVEKRRIFSLRRRHILAISCKSLKAQQKKKVSAESIVDYTQNQVLTSNHHESVLKIIAHKKIRFLEKKLKKVR